MVLDRARALEKSEEKDLPDIKLEIIFGGQFNKNADLEIAHFMKLKFKEN